MNDEYEALRTKWADVEALEERKVLARKMQRICWDFVGDVRLGQAVAPAARRRNTQRVHRGADEASVLEHAEGLSAMTAYLLRRLISTVAVRAMVGIFVVLLLRLAPGDPVAVIAGNLATPQGSAQARLTDQPQIGVVARAAMIRKKSIVDLEPFLGQARSSLIAPFANGIVKDRAVVTAAITSPWSNG